jgi:hypothetical protein
VTLVMNCPICHSELQVASSFCPFCGSSLEWAGAPPQGSASSQHMGAAVGLIALLVLGGLFASGVLVPAATRLFDDTKNILRNLACLSPALCTNSTFPTTTGKATYDQQVSMIFSQNFQSLDYNVTAAVQTDMSGYGPAYLLNGLSDTGYWYQVGLAYNWPLATGTSYDPGFHFIWEVFTPNGTTNNPVLSRTPDNINDGDIVALSLSFQTGTNSVLLTAKDYNTGASSTHTYTDGGGTIFAGSSNPRSSRTPTSLMTEWYHSSAYETSMKQVTYSVIGSPTQSAWICIGEYVPPNPNTLVYAQCSSLLTLNGQLQRYSYHGLNTYASQTEFQTGPS